jgi:Protein of unknown function (DUF3631)
VDSKDRRTKLQKLVDMLGSSNSAERERAWEAINKELKKRSKSWNDLRDLIKEDQLKADAAEVSQQAPPPPSSTNVNSLDLVRYVLEDYLVMEPHEYVGMTLWIHFAHIYQQFMFSPRLLLMSPVKGCGKTTALDLLSRLVPRAKRSDNATTAAIYRMIEAGHTTILLDEVDNLALACRNETMRSLLNSGHRKGSTFDRVFGKQYKPFSTFVALALGSIGMVPLPLMQRSIIIHMERAAKPPKRRLDDGKDETQIDEAYRQCYYWASNKPVLDRNPEMPGSLSNRSADNWRPLLAIADSFGPAWGELAREAAIIFARGHHDDDMGVVLLSDIRKVFEGDRMTSEAIVAALVALDDANWSDYCGSHEDPQPRAFRKGDLARLLKPFRITPRTIWPKGGTRADRGISAKGYYREQFEGAWASYCDAGGGSADSRPPACCSLSRHTVTPGTPLAVTE